MFCAATAIQTQYFICQATSSGGLPKALSGSLGGKGGGEGESYIYLKVVATVVQTKGC